MSIIKEVLYLKEYNKKIYDSLISNFKEKEVLYIATNQKDNINNPVIIPVLDTDIIAIEVFESLELATKYQETNLVEFMEIKLNDLLIIIDKLYFKGVTGILFFSSNKNYTTSYLYIEDLISDNDFIKKENKQLIVLLNKVLLGKNYLNYLHHQSLTADEILYCIVRFTIQSEGNKKYINIFEDESLAEKYCDKKLIYGKDKDNYPITTIPNSVLYHSMTKLCNKIDFIVLHTRNKKYKVDIDEFISLIIKIGFEQLTLD